MAYAGMVCNPSPEWPWPDEKLQPMQVRYLSGLYPLEVFAPLLRVPAGHVGMVRADRWIGLSDGGNVLEDRLRENFPRVEFRVFGAGLMLCHLRVLYRSEKGQWDAFWRRDYTPFLNVCSTNECDAHRTCSLQRTMICWRFTR
jgi:hypothetical protein